MKTEITIEAVKVDDKNYCVGCYFDIGDNWDCDPIIDNLVERGLPSCGNGFIYKLKEAKK